MRHDWSQSDILTLMTLYNEERPVSEISEVMDNPINAVKYKIQALRKDGTLTVLYKKCYICKSQIPATKQFNKCNICYDKSKDDLKGRLLLNLENI